MNYLKHLWCYIQNKYYDLIYPDLKNNRQYTPVDNNKKPCNLCKKVRPKSVIKCETNSTGEAGEVICIKCYHKNIGSEFSKLLLKWKRRLFTIGITLLFVVETSVIIYKFLPQNYLYDHETREAFIEYFYRRSDPNVSRNMLAIEINNILNNSKYPEIILALAYRESRFNCNLTHSDSGARGLLQVLPSWIDKEKGYNLKNDGIALVPSDLNDPIIGGNAGDKIFGAHLNEAGGDLMLAIHGWVGSKKEVEQEPFVRDVFCIYGKLQLIKIAVKEHKFNKNNIDKWWVADKKPTMPKKKRRP